MTGWCVVSRKASENGNRLDAGTNSWRSEKSIKRAPAADNLPGKLFSIVGGARFYGFPLLFIVVVLLATTLPGCYYLNKPDGPLTSTFYPADGQTRAENLLIFLPGIGDYGRDLERNGFIRHLHRQRSDVDVVTLDAHFSYYENRTLVDRLHAEFLLPARRDGYKRIHIAGISLGGFGALLALRQLGTEVDSVALIAPYLGEPEHYSQLLVSSTIDAPNADLRNLWPWITGLVPETRSRIFLAYGLRDKFALPCALLEKQIPAVNTVTLPGSHRWRTFTALWRNMLTQTDFLGDAKPADH